MIPTATAPLCLKLKKGRVALKIKVNRAYASVIIMLFAMLLLSTGTSVVDAEASADNLYLSKQVKLNTDGTYTITIEAFTTGMITTTTVPVDIVLVLDQSGSMGSEFGSSTQIKALKSAVTTFIAAVQKETASSGADHRIAIVGFAQGYEYDYYNTEVLSAYSGGDVGVQYGTSAYRALDKKTSLRAPNSTILTDAVNAIDNYGWTQTDIGMTMAKDILDSARAVPGYKRNQLVVLFSDGFPNSTGEFDTSLANRAITISKALKDIGVPIYSIGTFSDANPKGTSDANRFMSYISSNYPTAISMTAPRTLVNNAVYYKTAANAYQLNTVFTEISNNIAGEILSNATILDVVSPQFELRKDGEDYRIKSSKYMFTGYQKDANGNNLKGSNGEFIPTWSQTPTSEDLSAKINILDGGVVELEGYDFDLVGQFGSTCYGSKVIMELTVGRAEDFIGGNKAKFNSESSGLYDSKEGLIERFTSPMADIPVIEGLSLKGGTKSIYVGEPMGITPYDTFFDDIANASIGVPFNIGDRTFYTNGANNGYVNLSYTIFEGSDIKGVYTIPAGSKSGSWDTKYGTLDSIRPTDNRKFEMRLAVSPSEGGTISPVDVPLTSEFIIHVFKPKVTFKDLYPKTNDPLTQFDLDEAIMGDALWVNSDPKALEPDSKAPALSLTYDVLGKAPASIREGKVNVIKVERLSGDSTADILESTAFEWDDTEGKCNDSCRIPEHSADFAIHEFNIHNSAGPALLNTQDHDSYMIGYPKGMFYPNRSISRAEVATIFFRLLTEQARNANFATTSTFTDVLGGNWYSNAISTLLAMRMVEGYPDGTFKPDEFITRAEFAKIAVSFFKPSIESFISTFSDVAGHWAEVYIERAYKVGLIGGYPDGTFLPDKHITRAEAVRLINNTLGRKPHKDYLLDGMMSWLDNKKVDRWYYADIQEASNEHRYTWTESMVEGKLTKHEKWEGLLQERDWLELQE